MIDRESLEAGDSSLLPAVPFVAADTLEIEAERSPQEALEPAVVLPAADQVTTLALDLTTTALERYGNQLSSVHREALRQAVGLFTEVASGSIQGRYVLDLPTGLGKTTSIVCWAKAMIAMQAGWSLAICASRVEELCDIYAQLVSGEQPVSPDHIGLWHANSLDSQRRRPRLPPTFGPGQDHRYGDCPILLLTHQRVRQGPSIEQRLRFRGKPRSLVVYDESLTTTEAVHAEYGKLAGQLKQVRAKLGYDHPAAMLLGQLEDALDQEVARQSDGASPALIELPFRDALNADQVLDAISSHLGRDSELWRLIDHGPYPMRVVIIGKAREDATVIRYEVKVPDELRRMVVLDASYPVRRLLSLAGEHMSASAQALCLTSASTLQPSLAAQPKRYDQIEIHLMRTRGSGRDHAAKDLRNGVDGSAILGEIAAVVRDIPVDEAVIIWTFLKSADDLPDFKGLIEEALGGAGIDIEATVEAEGESKRRIVIETFGRETASNAYKYCQNVVFMGCLEFKREHMAGWFIAETRDLLVNVRSSWVNDLVRGEVYHRLYQAISRAACREVTVDQLGRTQAKPTRVWIMTRHGTIKQDLAGVLPGAQWRPWVPTQPDKLLATKTHMAAEIIRQYLDGLDTDRIGLKTIKAKVTAVLGAISIDTFQAARDQAIQGTCWNISGQSLVRAQE